MSSVVGPPPVVDEEAKQAERLPDKLPLVTQERQAQKCGTEVRARLASSSSARKKLPQDSCKLPKTHNHMPRSSVGCQGSTPSSVVWEEVRTGMHRLADANPESAAEDLCSEFGSTRSSTCNDNSALPLPARALTSPPLDTLDARRSRVGVTQQVNVGRRSEQQLQRQGQQPRMRGASGGPPAPLEHLETSYDVCLTKPYVDPQPKGPAFRLDLSKTLSHGYVSRTRSRPHQRALLPRCTILQTVLEYS